MAAFAERLDCQEVDLLRVLNEDEPPEVELAQAFAFLRASDVRMLAWPYARPWCSTRPILLRAPRRYGIFREPDCLRIFAVSVRRGGLAFFLLAFQPEEDAEDGASSATASAPESDVPAEPESDPVVAEGDGGFVHAPPPQHGDSFACHAAFSGPFDISSASDEA